MCGIKVSSRLRCLLKWWWILQWLTSDQDRCPNLAPAGAGEAVLSVRCGPGPLGPWTLIWTTVACLWQKGEWGMEGGERSCSISMAWPWPSGPMNTSMNNCGLSMTGEWTGFFWGEGGVGVVGSQVGAGGEAVLSVWHGHGPLGPWILLWTTVACLWQKGEWTVGVEEGGWGWGSVSMVWTWPSRLCY